MYAWVGMVFAAVAMLALSPAQAQDADRSADWIRKPTDHEMMTAWPAEALRQGLDGRATIRCIAGVNGLLKNCVVDKETPPGRGFGESALLLAPRFAIKPAIRNGQAVESVVTIPINFEGGGPAPMLVVGVKVAKTLPWTKAPGWTDVANAYPAKATGVGHVVLLCRLKASGALGDCDAATEQPRRQGFASAARKLASQFEAAVGDADPKLLRDVQVSLAFHFDKAGWSTRRVITKADWRRKPTPERAVALFPDKAIEAKVASGRAVVDCVADMAGELGDCRVLSEDPPGLGFGEAALIMGNALALNRWTEEGQPIEGAHVQFALRFVHKGANTTP